jgi:CelD/BcsL family acetyltransferase involved in cellulose biosynthesis
MPAPILISRVDDLDALWPRQQEWNALLRVNATDTVFQTLEWHRSWWQTLGDRARSLVLLAEAGGKLVGIAPLMISTQRVLGCKRRVVEFIGTHAADYCDFIVDPAQPAVVPAMLQWLREHAEAWDLLHLINIAEDSPLLQALPQAFARRGFTTDLRMLYECPTRIFGDREADKRLPDKQRFRRHYNQLRKKGRLEFRLCASAQEVEERLEPFFEQHVKRWGPTPTPSFFGDSRQRDFYREQVRTLYAKGWILFSVVSFDDRPISFHFGYRYGNRVYFIKSTFDLEYQKYAPGMLHIRYLLEHAMETGADEFDFTTGEEKFKYEFTNHVRRNYTARVYDESMFFGIDRFVLYAKEVARRSPRVRRWGKRIKPWLGTSLHRLGL